jgi:CubicO group peptidase (beta-lactamase class C family)
VSAERSTEWPGEAVGLEASRLRDLENAIRAGEFKKVTSVLVARRGKLAYELYSEGTSAADLRDTRSATKSITGMLVGLALDRGLLAGPGPRSSRTSSLQNLIHGRRSPSRTC